MAECLVEESTVHTRLLRFTLGIDESRTYWVRVGERPEDRDGERVTRAVRGYEEHWFGQKSQARVETILANLRPRYDAFPVALAVLARWRSMAPDTRRMVCHWHTQLADPMYRAFSGEFLVARRGHARAEVSRDAAVGWVEEMQPGRWALSTRIQWATKLLSAAFEAGLLESNRVPRPLSWPRVPDEALGYLLYLLRELSFAGTLVENPYLASVGLAAPTLGDRLRTLPGVTLRRMGDLVDFEWGASNLAAWAEGVL